MSYASCQSCGAALDDGAQFCKNCGSPVTASAPLAASAPQQPVNQQPYYQTAPPPYQQANQGYTHYAQSNGAMPGTEPLSVGQYIGMMLLSGIPFAGFILLLVWAFSSDVNVNKRNYAKAILILILVGIVLSIIFGSVLAGLFATLFSESSW